MTKDLSAINRRKKHTINYKDNELENEIFEWIEGKTFNSVLRAQDIIKQILLNEMINEKNKK